MAVACGGSDEPATTPSITIANPSTTTAIPTTSTTEALAPPPSVSTTSTTTPTTAESPKAAVPLGQPAPIGNWEIKVVGYDLDATQKVLDHRSRTEPPAEGNRYVLVNIEVTYRGEGVALASELEYLALGSRNTYEQCSFIGAIEAWPIRLPVPNFFGYLDQISGSVNSGNMCFEISHEEANSLKLLVTYLDDEYQLMSLEEILNLTTTTTTESAVVTNTETLATTLLLSCATDISDTAATSKLTAERIVEAIVEDTRAADNRTEVAATELVSAVASALDCLLGTNPSGGPTRFDQALQILRNQN